MSQKQYFINQSQTKIGDSINVNNKENKKKKARYEYVYEWWKTRVTTKDVG